MTATKITAAELHRRHTAQKKAKILSSVLLLREPNLSQEDIAALQKNNAYLNGVAAKALAGKLK